MKHLFKISFFILFLLIYSSYATSNTTNLVYSEKNISNYFSGIISINQNNTTQAHDFLKKVQPLKNEHTNFNIQFLRTLVLLEKFDKAFNHAKNLKKENLNFNEANILLGIKYFIEKDYINSEKHFKKINSDFKEDYFVVNYFKNFLISTVKAADGKQFSSLEIIEEIPNGLINLKNIQLTFLNCYFDTSETSSHFSKLVNDKEKLFSRYNFFLVNYLLHKDNIVEASKIIEKSKKEFQSNILIRQSDDFIVSGEYKKLKNFFNCQNPKHLMAEFFYILANFYSREENYQMSNFYMKISLYLNENFSSNKALLAENYFNQGDYDKAKKIYYSIKKIGNIYSWYASKKISLIISLTENKQKAVNHLENEIKKISEPTHYHYYDLANFFKSNENYKKAVEYYTKALKKLKKDDYLIPEILDSRGISYERLNLWSKAEQDLIESLEISPDQPYVLNYLAYSWLEKNINMNKSLKMLKKANNLTENDPYIIDSLGWAFYLNNNYLEAESFLRRAVELLPFDPVISDHYGDTLWQLNKNIQARYFWKHALNFEKEDKEFINELNQKLIFGLKKI